MTEESACLEGLPDELILEILLYLNTIRSSETQSTAFEQKDTEKRRQRENRLRQLALHGLCLTSHHFNRIATPLLYASFAGSTTWHGITSLRLFHRTVVEPKGPNGNKFFYAGYLQYVENRLADYQGNDLFADTVHPDAMHMVTEYFSLLAGIVNSASNLRHLSVVSVENSDISFWRYILRQQQNAVTPSFAFVAEHGLSNLEVLCVQTHIAASDAAEEASFRSICSAMASLPSLSDFRASRVVMNELVGPEVNIGPFKALQRLEIIKCIVNIHLVTEILLACKGLRHIVCEWAKVICFGETPFDLRPGLLHHSNTLETLALDFRQNQWEFSNTMFRDIGSFKQLERLEALTISKMGFFGGEWYVPYHPDPLVQHNIADWLPIGLKRLNLLIDELDLERYWDALDDLPELRTVSEACKSSTLNLVEMTVTSTCNVQGLTEHMIDFAQAGVTFKFIIKS